MLTKREIEDERNSLISQIKEYVPLFRFFFDLDLNLTDYSNEANKIQGSEVEKDRQDLVKRKLKSKFTHLFGDHFETEAKLNLNTIGALNIVDHHQMLNHPVLISSNIVANVRKLLKNEKQEAIVVVASGDVPPNNYFSRNGFQLHGTRVPVFSNSEKEFTSYFIPKREFNFIDRLKSLGRWQLFNREEKEYLQQKQTEYFTIDFSRCDDYNDQISVLVREEWKQLFENSLRTELPELLYISQEELTTELLIELLQEANFISSSLFDSKFREKVLINFDGIVVTWNEAENKGSHFFWRKYPNQPRSLRMYIKGNRLIPQDTRFKDLGIPLERDKVIEALKKREIYPSLFLIFSVLIFYCGIRPLAGYGSVVYLNLMKKAWVKTLSNSQFSNEVERVKKIAISHFVGGLALFFKRYGEQVKTLYAHDIFFEGGVTKKHLKTIFNMKFRDLLSVSLVDIYAYLSQKYIPNTKRIRPRITGDDLAKITFDWFA